MPRIIDALKELGKKCNTSHKVPAGSTTDEVIANIAKDFDITGDKGDDGASVTAITLLTTEGAVTGGTATLSDGTEIEITVTEAPAGE